MSDPIPILLAPRLGYFPKGKQPQGAVKRNCHKCFAKVWISPSSPYWTEPVQIICDRCAPKYTSREDSAHFTDATRLEIARVTGLYGDQIDWILENLIKPEIYGREEPE